MNSTKISGENVGDRVRLTVDVERYPHFIARKGSVGTITTKTLGYVGGREVNEVRVKMDLPIEGCEEWDNTIIWQDEETEYFFDQTEPIA